MSRQRRKDPDPLSPLRELAARLGRREARPATPAPGPSADAHGEREQERQSRTREQQPGATPEAERRLEFEALVEGTRPLDPSPARVAPSKSAGAKVAPATRPWVDGGEPPSFHLSQDEGWVEGWRNDVPAASARTLRGSEARATLDLHGLGEMQARRALASFVVEASARGWRVVLLVHGKGRHSPGGMGILGPAVVQWLTGPELGPLVRCFATADRGRGGSGALLVLLERLGAPGERR